MEREMPVVVRLQYSSLLIHAYISCLKKQVIKVPISTLAFILSSTNFLLRRFISKVHSSHSNLGAKVGSDHSIRKGKLEGQGFVLKIRNRTLENYLILNLHIRYVFLKPYKRPSDSSNIKFLHFFLFCWPISTCLTRNRIRIRWPNLPRIKSGSETLAEMRREFFLYIRSRVKKNATDWVSPWDEGSFRRIVASPRIINTFDTGRHFSSDSNLRFKRNLQVAAAGCWP